MNPDWNELPRKLQSFAHIIDQLKIRVKWTSEKKNFQKNLMIALLQRWEKKNLVHSIAIHSHRLSCVQLVWSDDESIHFWVMIQCPISLKKKHNLHPTNRPYTTKAIELEGKKKPTERPRPPDPALRRAETLACTQPYTSALLICAFPPADVQRIVASLLNSALSAWFHVHYDILLHNHNSSS